MKKSFSEEQIISILKQQENGNPVKEIIRQHNITEQTFYRWKSNYGEMEASDARNLKQLEEIVYSIKEIIIELIDRKYQPIAYHDVISDTNTISCSSSVFSASSSNARPLSRTSFRTDHILFCQKTNEHRCVGLDSDHAVPVHAEPYRKHPSL